MGVPDGVPEGRCGFTLEPEDLPIKELEDVENQSEGSFHHNYSIASCYRHVWNGRDRCIWHADVEEKPVEELVAARSNGSERLDGAILKGTKIRSSFSLSGCRLLGADLFMADLSMADLSNGINLLPNLSGANLQQANLSNTELWFANLNNADFRGAKLSEAKFIKPDLTGADFAHAEIDGAAFQSAVLFRSNFEELELDGLDLRGADLTEAKFHNAHFQNVIIDDDTTFGDENHRYRSAYEMDADGTATTELGIADTDDRAPTGYLARILGLVQTAISMLIIRLFARPYAGPLAERITRLFVQPYYAIRRWLFWLGADGNSNKEAIKNLKKAIWSYRTYQLLVREQALPDKIPRYYVREKHARRKLALAKNNYLEWLKLSLARWTMLYGESSWRVVGTSVVVIAIWTVLYLFAGGIEETVNTPNSITHDIGLPIGPLVTSPPELATTIFANLYFSVVTFTTLGYGDVQPASGAVQLLAGIQSLLGAALIALLVAVLSRRVMR